MMIKNAKELQEFISSIRAKAFEEVTNLIKSEAVTKDDTGFILMYVDDLIGLINAIDAAKPKQKKVESSQ